MSEYNTGARLLPCPFCGEAEKVYLQNGNIPLATDWHTMIWCISCGSLSGEYATDAEAIAAWNQRATPEPAGDLVEAVARAIEAEFKRVERRRQVVIWDDVARAAIAAIPDRAAPVAEVEALQAFKVYVHERLDGAGIPTHPEGQHSAAGCRVGDRLDIALDAHITLRTQLAASQADVARLREALRVCRRAVGGGAHEPRRNVREIVDLALEPKP